MLNALFRTVFLAMLSLNKCVSFYDEPFGVVSSSRQIYAKTSNMEHLFIHGDEEDESKIYSQSRKLLQRKRRYNFDKGECRIHETSFTHQWKFAHVHFIRIPKTGSTLAMAATIWKGPQCIQEKVATHDHIDGCLMLDRCNGTCVDDSVPTVAVVREPCDRFLSVLAHMQIVYWDQSNDSHGIFSTDQKLFQFLDRSQNWDVAVDSLLTFYRQSGCSRSLNPSCIVHYVNSLIQFNSGNATSTIGNEEWRHRAVLYPQSFYIGSNVSRSLK
jgi:hypothetical protein